MKALTVKNPWAWAIVHGYKDVENRFQQTHHRGRLAIHTAKTADPAGYTDPAIRDAIDDYNSSPVVPGELIKRADLTHFGYVEGTVQVVGCHHANDCRNADTGRLCSEWAHDNAYHWELAQAEPFVSPWPARGMLGLWDWDPVAEVVLSIQIHVEEFSTHPYSYFCSCGAQATGTLDAPARYSDHQRTLTP